ncbi:unnamed protein product [Arabidopsis lyrata]|nr:external alternative NAD(P)H-ubiquinone oxidoreductase B3, mitochondrial [Arabidopsis lyrata subsp. lyrata]CAH8275857.1 unnamed protein product [Arabidopsis lyrata]|eukprot:XP_002867844.2 external alternative NAD(P)H-ubiquinone oxidoreductase B3, mitochondrial [Arabidopsis lyrata subsp. lyrata]
MRPFTFFERFSNAFHDYPSLSRILVVSTISGGGLIVYSEANASYSNNGVETETRKKKVVLLGTGWAGASFLKTLNNSSYEVQVISPRNYFAFTPLLPSVTCGTVEARSVVEPIRNIGRKNVEMSFLEAECVKIDPRSKKVYCRSKQGVNSNGKREFDVDYDYLVIATGAQSNTFNIPGVEENCHFLKEVEDAQRIRSTVIDSFEKVSLPGLNEEERKRMLHFVVVGGGPTGVEFASELHDFVNEDLVKLYPKAKNLVQITLLEAADHILTMFDKRITEFAEEKFTRDGIDVKLGSMVVKVNDKEISAKTKGGEVSTIPYGMIVWSTGIGTRPVIKDFMKQIGQGNRRALATDEWLRVEGCDNIYALGDCATINQRKVMEDIAAIFKKADKENSGTLTMKEFQEVMGDICDRYPQVQLYLKSKGMHGITDLLKEAQAENGSNKSVELDIEELKSALCQVDSQVKLLPATGQVAAQQGTYLAKCFDRMEVCEKNPEGPIRIRGEGRHRFRPFRYRHLGQFAPLGGEQTAAQLPGDWVSIGHSSQWLWYSVYASKQVSWRTRVLVVSDWMRRFIFGRDSSRI